MTLPILVAVLLSAHAPTQAPDGKAIFETNCQRCHGPTGKPSAPMKKLIPELPTWDEAFFAARPDSAVIAVITNGKGEKMKAWKDTLKPDEIAAVAKYIRTLKP